MMLSSFSVIAIFCLYMGFLFGLALWAQKRSAAGRSLVDNPLIYSLSLGVYCSSWTFYGSVGLAANHGLLFLAIYLGPTLVAVFGGGLWAKIIRLKNTHRITSIADFISTRYEKSEQLAALVTLVSLVGTIPYVALQLKAVLDSFAVITTHQTGEVSWVGQHVSAIVVGLMILFTIIFGVRSLEPTERHEGMVMAVAMESLVKLVSLVAAGLFVCFWVFDGVGDIFEWVEANPASSQLVNGQAGGISMITWVSYIILSANAIICLPRQFHVAVVENRKPAHIRWAMWLFPLYLFIINLFIYPVAVGGLLQGYPLSQADTYVLQFPMNQNNNLMALLIFIGGFSAATSMILISSMTMATMISNHLLLPLVDWIPQFVIIERRLLQCRWVAVAVFIILGYLFERYVAGRLPLASIGMLSFAAVLQLAPALFGGLFWRGGNKNGAYWGLLFGFAIWFYTLLLPVFAGSGWVTDQFMENGPFGIELLKPNSLFGISGFDPISHTVFWSLLLNTFFYILGSLAAEPSLESKSQAEAFVGSATSASMFQSTSRRLEHIQLHDKQTKIRELLTRYFGRERATFLTAKALSAVGLSTKNMASISELAELYDQVERTLGGSIGSATANRALSRVEFFTVEEYQELKEMYAEILADLSARPADMKRRIDFYKERQTLIERHAEELEEKVNQLEKQISMRREVESQLRESEERYRLAIESSNDGVAIIRDLTITWGNRRLAEIFGYKHHRAIIDRPLSMIVHPYDTERVLDFSRNRQAGDYAPKRYDFLGIKKDGSSIYIAVSATTMVYQGETLILAFLRDVTLRRLAEEQIHHLSQRLIDGIEEERRRLAADLHDEFGQALTGLHLGVQSMLDNIPAHQLELQRDAQKLISVIELLAESLRTISGSLRPDMLDHLGLVPTAEWYVGEFKERATKLDVHFQAVGFGDRRLTAQHEIVLYRILQESLNNVVKHAEASEVTVQLTFSYPRVIMVVRDDGKGFQPSEAETRAGFGKGGIGLISMKERVASIGGAIDIRSGEKKGTMIKVVLPLSPTQAEKTESDRNLPENIKTILNQAGRDYL